MGEIFDLGQLPRYSAPSATGVTGHAARIVTLALGSGHEFIRRLARGKSLLGLPPPRRQDAARLPERVKDV
jgi:hypothetical protein